jgi:hypothetical protein
LKVSTVVSSMTICEPVDVVIDRSAMMIPLFHDGIMDSRLDLLSTIVV